MKTPPAVLPQTPGEMIRISPEALDIANCYLALQSIMAVSKELGLPTDYIAEQLDRRDVRAYIDGVFRDVGYNNQFKIADVVDALIDKKLEEMAEADVGSSKDITEILALKHKMNMEYLDKQIKLETLRQAGKGPKSQVNVQINEAGGGSAYGSLIEKLISGKTIS